MDDALRSRLTTVEVLLAALLAAVLAVGIVLDGTNYLVVFAVALAVVTFLGTALSVLES